MTEVLVDVATFAAGALLIGVLGRRASARLSRWTVVAYAGLAALAVAPALFTTRTQVALDFAYQFPPWREALAEPPSAGNPLLTDVALQILPFRHLARERLLAGEMPLWSHELGTGQPLLGNAQSAPFAPLHLMALHLPPERSITVAAGWQVLLALVGTHLLALGLGAGAAGAGMAAVAFALSSFAFAWLDYPLAMSAAWIPALLAAVLAVAQGRRAGLAAVVCALGLLLSGHPQVAAQGLLVAVGVGVIALRGVPSPERRARASRLAIALAAACLLAAPVLAAELDGLGESERWLDARDGQVAAPRLEAISLLSLAAPLALGSPRFGNWSGPGNFQESATLYVGALPLALALAGATRRRDGTRGLLLGAGLALALGLGIVTAAAPGLPALGALLDRRVGLYWTLLVALAAGRGLELAKGDRGVRRAFAGFALLTALAAAGWVAPGESVWPSAWRVAVGLAALAAVSWSARSAGGRTTAALVGVTAAELLLLGVPYNPAADLRRMDPPPPAVAALRDSVGSETPARVAAIGGRYLAYLPAIDGLWDPRGWDPARPGVAARLLRERLRGDRPGRQILLREGFDRGLVDFLGVRFVLGSPATVVPAHWSPVWQGAGAVIWRNPGALPLFFTPGDSVAVTDRARAAEGTARSGPATISWEGPVAPVGTEGAAVEVLAIEPRSNGFRVEVESPGAGIIASSVTWAPGWTARSASGPRAVGRVNGAFLGLVTRAGDSWIELRYAPRGWAVALVACALGLLLATALARRERRPEAA